MSCRREADGTLVPSSGSWRNAGIVSPTECWTLSTLEFPSDVEEFSLLDISVVLETIVPSTYFLTAEAASGMLRRDSQRMSSVLNAALTLVGKPAAESRPPASERERGKGTKRS